MVVFLLSSMAGVLSVVCFTYAVFNVPASYIANPGTVSVTATNPAPGGGTGSAQFTITQPVFRPIIHSVSPSPITTNGQSQNLTISGANFSGATVFFNNTVVQQLSSNTNTIQVNVPVTQLIPGTYTITVTNFDGHSTSTQVTVQNPPPMPNPPPVISSFSPSSLPANGLTQTLTISGDKFSNPSVTFNGSPVQIIFNNQTTIQISISGSWLSVPGNPPIRVTNSDGQSVSSSVSVYDPNPAPIISRFNPIALISNNSAQTLIINGNNFSNNASVSLNGVAVQVTANNNPHTIEVNVPAFLLTAAANDVPVRVTNSDGKSTVMNINIITPQSLNPVPQITSLSPASVLAGISDVTLTINGSGFINGFTTFTFGFSDQPLVPTSVTESVAVVTIPKWSIAHANDYQVKAFNYAPGGGTGTGVLTVIYPPAPTLTSVTPASLNPTGQQQNLTINGSDFFTPTVEFTGRNSSGVAITRTLQIVSANTTALQVIVPAEFLQQGGYPASIKVTNYGGQFAVSSPIPIGALANTIFSIMPSSVPVQTPDNQTPATFSVEINDNTITAVIIAGVSIPVTITPTTPGSSPSPYIMTFSVPAALLQTPGRIPVSYILNGQTLTAEICVYPLKPTITKVTLTPHGVETNQIRKDQAKNGFVITLEGTNFTSQSKFSFGITGLEGTDITPGANIWKTAHWTPTRVVLLVQPDQIFGNRVGDSIRTGYPYYVSVINPSCLASAGGRDVANVYITPSLSPLSVQVGRPPFDLTVYGAEDGDFVYVAGISGKVSNEKITLPTMFAVSSGQVFTYKLGGSKSSKPKPDTVSISSPSVTVTCTVPDCSSYTLKKILSDINVIVYNAEDPESPDIDFGIWAGSFHILPPQAPKITNISYIQGSAIEAPQLFANRSGHIKIKGEFTYFPAVSGNPPDISRSTSFELWKGSQRIIQRSGNVFWSETYQQLLASDIATPGIYTIKLITPDVVEKPYGTTEISIRVRSGIPVISNIASPPVIAGVPIDITINGSNFNPTTQVFFNNRRVSARLVSFNQLVASITAQDIPRGQTYSITVVNPDEQETATHPITASWQSSANINSLSPSSVTLPNPNTSLVAWEKGSATTQSNGDINVTVIGTNLKPTTQIRVNGKIFTATFIDSTRMVILLPVALLEKPAELLITAFNAGQADTVTASSLPFKIKTPVPALTALSAPTTTATLDNRTWTMTVTGRNFFPGARVIYNGTTLATSAVKVESATSLRVVLPDVPITAAQYRLAVVNPSPTDSASNTLTFNVVYPQPVLHATGPLSPVTTTASLSPWTITLRGGNFSENALVSLNGQSVPFVYVNSTQLRVPMPEAATIAPRTLRLAITNPTPGGGSTDTLTVNVLNPVPVVDSLSLTTSRAGSPVQLRIMGSRFAAAANVLLNGTALTSGVTVENPASILVNLSAEQVRTAGNYTFVVNNAAPGGGNSSGRTLRIVPAFASSVEFTRVTTAIVAGNRLSGVTLRFRDESGNLTDFDGTLRFANASGTSTGTISLRRSSLGVSTATATRFNLADTYTLRVDSVPTSTGRSTFEVVPATDFSVVVSGVPVTQVAGATLPSFTLAYFDRLGNPTDDRLGEVRIRHDQKGYLHVLSRTQVEEGIYTTSPLNITTTGTYSVFVTGITVSNITGNRTVAITPASVVSAEFMYVDSNFAAGSRQTAFRVTYRDSFGNLSDGPAAVTASATTAQGTSTATIALTKHATAGYYTAESVAFSVPGTYTLAIQGIAQYSGQRTFTVTPLGAYFATITGMPAEREAGSTFTGVSLRLTDRLGNPITNNIGTVALRHSRGFYHALTTQAQANGVYQLGTMQLTTVGTYTLSVSGIATENLLGNRTTTVSQASVASATFQSVDSSFNAGSKQTAFRVTYRDSFGNLLDGPETVAVSGNNNISSTATISLTKVSTGVYTATQVAFTVAGSYSMSIAGVPQYSGTRTFTVLPIAASWADVSGVQANVTAGAQQGAITIRLTDAYGNRVVNGIGAVSVRHERGFTHVIPTQHSGNGVYMTTQAVQLTTVGTYSVNIGGIATANITGNRNVLVAAAAVASATFQSVDTLITAGGNQVAFRVTYRDAFGNLVDGAESATALATIGNATSTATISLTKTSLGVFTAAQTAFTRAGFYTLSIAGIAQHQGARTFTVNPAAAATVEIRGVQANIVRGASQSGITLAIADRFGNATDRNSVLRFTRTTTNPASTGTIALTRTALGQMSAEATAFAVAGTYRLTVDGITASSLLGSNTFTVTTAATVAAFLNDKTSSFTSSAESFGVQTSIAQEEAVAGVTPLSVMSYPNPAQSDVEIIVRLPREERVMISLRDNLGRVVAIVTETTLKAGENRLNYNLSSLPNGAYHCTVESQSGRTVRPMIIAR